MLLAGEDWPSPPSIRPAAPRSLHFPMHCTCCSSAVGVSSPPVGCDCCSASGDSDVGRSDVGVRGGSGGTAGSNASAAAARSGSLAGGPSSAAPGIGALLLVLATGDTVTCGAGAATTRGSDRACGSAGTSKPSEVPTSPPPRSRERTHESEESLSTVTPSVEFPGASFRLTISLHLFIPCTVMLDIFRERPRSMTPKGRLRLDSRSNMCQIARSCT